VLAVEYVITPAAVTDAIRLHQRRLLGRYRMAMLGVSIVGIAIAVASDVSFGISVAVFGFVLLAMTWMGFVDRWLAQARARRLIGGTCRYVLDEVGIHYEHPLGSGTLAWSAITTMSANDKSIVFARDRVMAAYIPTNAFASTADRDALLAFARQRLAAGTAQA
jgi:hypothetical protein